MSATRRLSTETIAALRKLHAETPAGEWRYSFAHVTAFYAGGGEEHVCNFTRTQNRGQNTAAFIAEAHARFPVLLDLAEEALRLRADLAAPEASPPRCYDLAREGGNWLGDARSWVQRKKHNGERVTWGSGDVLHPPMTIREVEEVASEAAAGALRDRWEAREQLRVLRERRFHREGELLGRAERAEAEVERLRRELKR
jgi:hypothetical protein